MWLEQHLGQILLEEVQLADHPNRISRMSSKQGECGRAGIRKPAHDRFLDLCDAFRVRAVFDAESPERLHVFPSNQPAKMGLAAWVVLAAKPELHVDRRLLQRLNIDV